MVVAAALLAPGRPAAKDPDCFRWREAFESMPERTVAVEAGSGRLELAVRVADTAARQAAGFQCSTPAEIARTVILFDFGGEILTGFHMRNVPAPLDIAFAKADGRVFAIRRMDPSPTAVYSPFGAFRYALEARAGFFAQHGIRQGAARLVPRP